MLFKCVGTDPESTPKGSVAILESIDPAAHGATIKVRADVPAAACPGRAFTDGQVFEVTFTPMKPAQPRYEPLTPAKRGSASRDGRDGPNDTDRAAWLRPTRGTASRDDYDGCPTGL